MLNNLITIFLSIIIEALPFVLIGVFASSLIHLFISEELISRIIPKQRFARLLIAPLLGILFPICECGIVLVVRRLIQKGVPPSAAITFMLAVPIINPVVAASTHMAFPHIPMLYYRMIGAFIIAVLIGLIIELFFNRPDQYLRETPQHDDCCDRHLLQIETKPKKKSYLQNAMELITHAGDDLFVMGKYLIMGSFLAALIQSAVSRELLVSIGQGETSSIAVMMLLAYGLSICSEADAFVASSFSLTFIPASLTAFLLYGPMTDIKNTLMMLGCFKAKFVAIWLALITVSVFLLTYLMAILL